MKTESHSINDVLAKNATSFFIPPFQRAYAWGKPEIQRYFSDILRIIDSEVDQKQYEKLEHFFGTIVIKEEKSGFANKSVVVDGQQRLTTTLLFLIALRDADSNPDNKEFITQNYLINGASTFEDKIKLKQVTKDWEAYRALVKQKTAKPGIVNNAYLFFSKSINEQKKLKPYIKTEHYITAIRRMNVAVIFLDERPFKGEDPQIIFETLNSLGKPLTLSDLVRNFILLSMNSDDQSNIYEKIWHPKIESILNENTSQFFRDYLQYKTSSSIKVVSDNNTKEIYQLFKSFVEDKFINRDDFINDIVQFANWYKWIIFDDFADIISSNTNNNHEIKELLRNVFHDIKAEAFKPFVLGLLECHQKGFQDVKLNDKDFISILKIIRTYLIRKRVLSLTQGENKYIVLLCDRIGELAKGHISMFDLLCNMFYRMRLPNDNEMRDVLAKMNFYSGLKNYRKFILGKMEEQKTKVAVDFRKPEITIEHIMPQQISTHWKADLGQDFENIHDKYLHNIGNLILTEFNSEMGNRSFEEKKRKLISSSLSYRLFIINQNIWNENTILEHQNNMINLFLETFPLPDHLKDKANWNTNIDEGRDSRVFSPLDEDAGRIAEGNKPISMRIENTILIVATWRDVFINFLKYIRDNESFDFEFVLDNQNELFGSKNEDVILKWSSLKLYIENHADLANRYKTFDGKFCKKMKEISEDELFIHVNISAENCINRIANVMNKFNIPEDFIELTLK